MSAEDSPELFDHVALIGIGLIGSSLAHAIRRGGLARPSPLAERTPQSCSPG